MGSEGQPVFLDNNPGLNGHSGSAAAGGAVVKIHVWEGERGGVRGIGERARALRDGNSVGDRAAMA